MFDLFRSRDKIVRFGLGGLLVVVALSMLLYLIPGAGVPSYGAGDQQVVAEIGKDKLTEREVNLRIQAVFRGQKIPPDVIEVYVPTLVQSMIAERAQAYEAKRLGFEVTDAQVAQTIRSFPQVGTLPPDQYRMAIEQMGYSVPEFEDGVRKQLLQLSLQNVALEGVVVTPQEVNDMFRKANEKIKISYIAFSPEKLKSTINPTPAELQAYYERTKGAYTTPETRNVALVIADQAKIAATIQVADAQAQQYYDSHKDQFRTPERVHVRHILLQTTGKSPAEVEKIKARGQDLLKQVRSGGDFADLAKKNSEDPGSKDKGGDLGWVTRGQTVKNFENAAFSLKPGETSDLITTEYGFHIIQVLEKENAQLQPFDKVKAQIAAEMNKQQVNEKMQTLADQARAELVKAPQNAEQIANKLGLQYIKADNVRPGMPLPGVGVNKELDDAIASMKKGDVTPVVQTSPAALGIAVVTAVNPPHVPPFSEVEAQVRNRMQTEQAIKMATSKAKEAADMLKSNGSDLAAAAKALGVEVKTSDLFTRNGAIEGLGGAAYFGDAFGKPVGAVIGPVNAGGVETVAKIVDKAEPDMTQLAKERDNIIQQIKGKKAEERNSLFQDSVVTKLVQEGKVKIHREVMNQIIARYRATS